MRNPCTLVAKEEKRSKHAKKMLWKENSCCIIHIFGVSGLPDLAASPSCERLENVRAARDERGAQIKDCKKRRAEDCHETQCTG